MAAGDPPDREPPAAQDTVALDRFGGVVSTSRMKAAPGAAAGEGMKCG
jgi:hypothetical protein